MFFLKAFEPAGKEAESMFVLNVDRMSFDKDLQIIQADVRVEVDGEVIIDEPLCIDVGLPALLYSCFEPTLPNRWAPAEQWQRIPFFVCGCGDPECRAYSFRTRPLDESTMEWTAVDETETGTFRVHETYRFSLTEYREQVLRVGEAFLSFVEMLDYRPYMQQTVPVVRRLVEQLRPLVYGRK
jgi:hypothetical protein